MRDVSYFERLVSTVCQHVSVKPALTGGGRVVHLAAFPQTPELLCVQQKDIEEGLKHNAADTYPSWAAG